ncbi:MAG: hypothetical protein KAY50_05495 [Chitinophagaceae bacterium]|nr:hypothetical protein [Chitinophagaceae bacterium]HQW45161.1 hypothetical protein [Chitinophagaceae bacterium]
MSSRFLFANIFLLFSALSVSAEATFNSNTLLFTEIDSPMYLYSDKNSNGYYFYRSPSGNGVMEYVPITKLQSSSGEYSGGKMFISTITKADYDSITTLFENLFTQNNCPPSQTTIRQKGTAAVTLLVKRKRYGTNDKAGIYKTCGIDDRTVIGKNISSLITNYKAKYEQMANLQTADTINIAGIIKEKTYVSKRGVVVDDLTEYFFIPAKEDAETYSLESEYFINLMEGSVKVKELIRQKDKLITIKAAFNVGLWDTESELQQSRKGNYVAIFNILNQ